MLSISDFCHFILYVDIEHGISFRDGATDPNPKSDKDNHGTSVTGLIAAVRDNNICIPGVAYNSTIVGVQLLGTNDNINNTVDSDEATAFLHYLSNVDIYSNSWGPPEGSGFEGPGYLAKKALRDGVTTTTTTIKSGCTNTGIQGTSFSAPIASAIIAMTLESNPNLTWRDIQHLVVLTSNRNNFTDTFSDWSLNGANQESAIYRVVLAVETSAYQSSNIHNPSSDEFKDVKAGEENKCLVLAGAFSNPEIVRQLSNEHVIDLPDLFCSHEEADTRILLHVIHSDKIFQQLNIRGRIIVKCSDTDVLVLCVHYFKVLVSTEQMCYYWRGARWYRYYNSISWSILSTLETKTAIVKPSRALFWDREVASLYSIRIKHFYTSMAVVCLDETSVQNLLLRIHCVQTIPRVKAKIVDDQEGRYRNIKTISLPVSSKQPIYVRTKKGLIALSEFDTSTYTNHTNEYLQCIPSEEDKQQGSSLRSYNSLKQHATSENVYDVIPDNRHADLSTLSREWKQRLNITVKNEPVQIQYSGHRALVATMPNESVLNQNAPKVSSRQVLAQNIAPHLPRRNKERSNTVA
ncbi:unnamed protein product [Mytilus edulis]|uniref:Peptidase S8/S53 domain-containing protein n=1 Tax=Mytilus edulis TaxID=6550 RepID=A0A8S3UHP3_MYTED|nr:unnamed protein product [Mytilus edulis]